MTGLLLALALGCSAAMAAAQTVDLSIRTDRPEAVYARGETATFIIEMKDGDQPVPEAAFEVELSADGFAHSEKRQVTIRGGRAEVHASRPDPSMLWIRATYTPEDGEAVKSLAGAAFSYEEILPSMPPPDDFEEFWESRKALMDAVPMNPVLTPMPCPAEGYEIFDVRLDGLDGTMITGYLAKPVGDGPFPGLVRFQWSGVYSLSPSWSLNYARWGYIAFNMNPHDIENGKPQEYYDELSRGRLAAYSYQGRGSREKLYFGQMYLRCYRAVEFLASRPEWNGRTLVSSGHSMGGGQALAAAFLNPRVTALAIDSPGMCDYTAMILGRKPGWPGLVEVKDGELDPTTLTAARYIDGMNFASRIDVPAVVGTAFKDLAAPSSATFAVYNALKGPKRIAIDPLSEHSGEKPNWRILREEFLREQAGK